MATPPRHCSIRQSIVAPSLRMVVFVILPQRRQAINCHCTDSRPAANGPMILAGRRRLTVLLVVAAVKFLVDLIVLGPATQPVKADWAGKARK